jgi:hypothetical protein
VGYLEQERALGGGSPCSSCAVGEYAGTLVVISHDRRFLDEVVATRTISLPL